MTRYILSYFTLLFFLTTFNCNAQKDELIQSVAEVFYNPQIIKTSVVRSVIVYADINEENSESMENSGKVSEAEFDENGNLIYQLSASNHGNLHFIDYGRGSIFSYFEYDGKGRKTASYNERWGDQSEVLVKYDEDGNKSREILSYNNKVISDIQFHWTTGKMVRAEVKKPLNSGWLFDDKGKMVLTEPGDSKTTYQYEQNGDTLLTRTTFYRSNQVSSTTEVTKLVASDRMIHYSYKREGKSFTDEIKASYDANMNVVRYSFTDAGYDEQGEKQFDYVEEVVNEYNAQGLLIKRTFYTVEAGQRRFTQTQRFIYATDQLQRKLPKGYLMKAKEMDDELQYNDSLD